MGDKKDKERISGLKYQFSAVGDVGKMGERTKEHPLAPTHPPQVAHFGICQEV